MTDPRLDPIKNCIRQISSSLDADIYLFSAGIDGSTADRLIDLVKKNKNKQNVVLILSTSGGDPHAAFRIARFMQNHYEKFIVFIFGFCKSAGTLITIGANEVVMSDWAELGPLDVQVYKDDHLLKRSSGLDIFQAMEALNDRAYELFEKNFLGILKKGGGVITTKTAADIASSMATGLLAPIAGQIDPLTLGEMHRSNEIAFHYGYRLDPDKFEAIGKLVYEYPSHGFVIDYKEAKQLFGESVREASPQECELETYLYSYVRSPASETIILNLLEIAESLDQPEVTQEHTEESSKDETDSNTEKINGDKADDNTASSRQRNNGKKTSNKLEVDTV